jgi:hypothetical protein|tara:strand:+ start:383 stop:574 length:192 start_codon:yes stop_codon:yes gene_type:complete
MAKTTKIHRKEDSTIINFTVSKFFSNIDDEILIQMAYAGKLLDLCNALSIELNSSDEKDSYTC